MNKKGFTPTECTHENMEIHAHHYSGEIEMELECPDCGGDNMYYFSMGEKLQFANGFELVECQPVCLHCNEIEDSCSCHTCRFCGETAEYYDIDEQHCGLCENEEEEE